LKVWIKLKLIKLFKLEHLSDVISKERDKQKDIDKKFYDNRVREIIEKKDREIEYLRTSYDYDIKTLEEEIRTLKIKEKEVDEKDLRAKNQINANVHIATRMYSEMKNCSDYLVKTTAKINRAMNEALDHKKVVEKIEK